MENVTMDYEKATNEDVKNVNHGAANIVRKLELQTLGPEPERSLHHRLHHY